MCGIIGYYGFKNTKEVLLEGLKNLEYRGYDSAGVSIWDKGSFKRIRAEGDLSQLDKKLKNLSFSGPLGIGHIRWATHGRSSELNAHPHTSCGISIVHNGIVENDLDLKTELSNKGISFSSETDSELLVHLISEKFSKEKKGEKRLLRSVLQVIPMIQGSYSVLVISEDHPDEMVAFKKGLPLLLGQTKDSILVASDAKALLPYTRDIVYLKDHEVSLIRRVGFKNFNLHGVEIQNAVQGQSVRVHEPLEKAEKKGFDHFMLKEIFEQPEKVRNLLMLNLSKDEDRIVLKDLRDKKNPFLKTKKIFIVACGSSFYAALMGKFLFEKNLEIPVEVDFASEFRYRDPLFIRNSLVLLVSQSGETADTLAVLDQVKNKEDVQTLGICNEKLSSLARNVDDCLYLEAGVERAVASTKSFTNTLVLFYLLSLRFKKNLNSLEEKEILRDLKNVTFQMKRMLQQCEGFFSKNISSFSKQKGFFFIGRGPHYPMALEGALKIKELAYRHAEGYPAGELKHGPLAVIDPSMLTVVLCPRDSYYRKTLNSLIEVKTREGKILAIGNQKDEDLKKLSDYFISIPEEVGSLFYPLFEVIPLQFLAYFMAKFLDYNIDHPRNLAKSVTVE